MCLMIRKVNSLIAVLGQSCVMETFYCNDAREEERNLIIGTDARKRLSQSSNTKNINAPLISGFLLSSNPSSYFYRVVSMDPCSNKLSTILEEDLCSLESKRLECATQEIFSEVACIDDCIHNLLLAQTISDEKMQQFPPYTDARTLISPNECHILFNFHYNDVQSVMESLEKNRMIASDFDYSNNDGDFYYLFYQTLDGTYLFLDDLCVKCLLKDRLNSQKSKEPSVVNDSMCEKDDYYSNAACDQSSKQYADNSNNHKSLSTDVPFPSSVAKYDAHFVLSLPTLLDSLTIQNIEEEIVDTQFKKK